MVWYKGTNNNKGSIGLPKIIIHTICASQHCIMIRNFFHRLLADNEITPRPTALLECIDPSFIMCHIYPGYQSIPTQDRPLVYIIIMAPTSTQHIQEGDKLPLDSINFYTISPEGKSQVSRCVGREVIPVRLLSLYRSHMVYSHIYVISTHTASPS